MLDEKDPWLDRVTDADVVNPLSDIARKERTSLLIANLLMFAVFQMRLVPNKIDFLGLEAKQISSGAIMIASVLGVIYFAFSFLLTTRSEYRAWRTRLESLRERHELRQRFYLNKRLEKAREFLNSDIANLAESKGMVFSEEQKRDAIARQISTFGKVLVASWNEYKRAYEIRFFVDAQLPLVITAANLVATAIAVILQPHMLQGKLS